MDMAMNIGALFAIATPQGGSPAKQLPAGFEALLANLMASAPPEPFSVTSLRFEEPSSGPPGTAPPPDLPNAGICGEELKTEEPNAQSKKPDLPAPNLGTMALMPFLQSENPHAELGSASNGDILRFLENRSSATNLPVEPFEAAFQKLVSDPALGVKMVRVETSFVASSTTGAAMHDALVESTPLQAPASAPDDAPMTGGQLAPVSFPIAPNLMKSGPMEPPRSSTEALQRASSGSAAAAVQGQTESDGQPNLLSKKSRTESKGLIVSTAPSAKVEHSSTSLSAGLDAGSKSYRESEFLTASIGADPGPDGETFEALPSDSGLEPEPQVKPAHLPAPTAELRPVGTAVKVNPAESPSDIRERIVGQVADRIEMLAATRRDSVTVLLNPVDLGEIKVVIEQTRGHVEAKVYAQDERVRQMLQASHPMLGQTLEQRGIKLELFSVGSMSPSGQDLANAHHNHTDLQQHTHTPRARFEPEPVKPQVLTSAAKGVDYTI